MIINRADGWFEFIEPQFSNNLVYDSEWPESGKPVSIRAIGDHKSGSSAQEGPIQMAAT